MRTRILVGPALGKKVRHPNLGNHVTTVQDLIEEFEDLDPREANQLLDEYGRDLPTAPDSMYVKDNIVPGCQSRVWMLKSLSDQSPEVLEVIADSDAIIVKGLIFILLEIYNGKTPQEALDYDYVKTFDELKLSRLITPQRKNGLFSMVKSIRDFAADSLGVTSQASNAGTSVSVSNPTKSRSIENIKSEFPILCAPLPSGELPVFLDSGASAQKPESVIQLEREVQEQYYANAFRGRYYFGQRVDDEIESTRHRVAGLLGAQTTEEIVFTSGTTMSINLVAAAWGRKFLREGDEVVITEMEHHANFVPWQVIAHQRGAKLRVIRLNADGTLDLEHAQSLIGSKTKMVAFCSMSNVLGTVNPIRELTKLAHEHGAVVCVDAAQSIPHSQIDVTDLDIDFLVFSGHKLYGPSGVGVLYGRRTLLDSMDPFLYGGHMISQVGREQSTWSQPPAKFEAGTMPIVQIIALGAAIDFVQSIGYDQIANHEHRLLVEAHEALNEIDGLTIFGPSVDKKGAIASFSIDGVATEDLAIRLDDGGIFTRHGHHCAMVLHETLGVPATTRASFGVYNTSHDVRALADCVAAAVSEIRS